MGDGHPFRLHWLRGARAFLRVGSAMFWATMGAGLLALAVFGAFGWVTDHFRSPSLAPGALVIAGFIFLGALLLAPFFLSQGDDNDPVMPTWRLKASTSPSRPVPIALADGFSFLDGVLCEQARPEADERWVLVGAYGRAIVVPSFPNSVLISGLLNVEATQAFLDPVHIRFRLGDREILRTEFAMGGYRGCGTITLIPRQIEIPDSGTLHVDMGMDGRSWTEVMCKSVIGRGADTDDAE